MKLKLDIDPDIVAMMAAEIAAGERAVTAAMREAGTGLKTAWRLQITGAGLGPRLANSIRSQNFPRSGESLDAAALVWSKAPVIVCGRWHSMTRHASNSRSEASLQESSAMSEFRLMPRLDNHGVRRLISLPDFLRTGSISERMEAAGTSVSYASSGGSRADAADLKVLQEQIVALAKRFGFPNEGRAAGRASFDAECAQWLVEAPIISGGEALRDDVWAFVACCIAPEVVLWRFEDGHADRFHGGLRNTFQRLWLRAHSLDRGAGAPQRWQLVEALSEDAVVQIVERPSIGGDPMLARAIAEAWLATANRIGARRMEDVTRRAVRRIRIDNEITCLASLGEPELVSRLQGFFDEAAL